MDRVQKQDMRDEECDRTFWCRNRFCIISLEIRQTIARKKPICILISEDRCWMYLAQWPALISAMLNFGVLLPQQLLVSQLACWIYGYNVLGG